MDYLPPRPLDAHNAFILGSKLRVYINGATNHNLASISIRALYNSTAQHLATSLVNFFSEQRIGWQLELAAEKGIAFGISMPSSSIFSSVLPRINRSLSVARRFMVRQLCAGSGWPVLFDPACYWGDRECDLAMLPLILNSRHKSMTAISQYPRYLPFP